uniref:Chromo domain-containing protein n=1 Tax=Caenorhabditis japonica TaxID=281687 RepID=A0A8R1I365_CAEJA
MSRDSSVSGDGHVPEAKEGKSEEIFEVEKILAHKLNDNILKLKVRWLGYGEDEDTWEPEEDLQETAGLVVSAYFKKNKCSDRYEMIDKIKKKSKKATPAKRHAQSDEESAPSDDNDSEASYDTARKTSAKKPKRGRKPKDNTPLSSVSKVPTKAALKSYDSSNTSSTPIAPNNAKKAAIIVREARAGWLDESSDDDKETTPSEIEKIADKVKRKEPEVKRSTPVASVAVAAVTVPEKEKKSPSPQPCSTNSASKKQNGGKETPSSRQRTLASPVQEKKVEEFTWSIQGIIRHVDDNTGTRTKLILMKNCKTQEQKVVEPRA